MIRSLSYSQFDTFAGCPRRWQLSRLYEAKRKSVALHEGDLWHIMMAKVYKGQTVDQVTPIAADYLEALLEHREDCDERNKIEAKWSMMMEVFKLYHERVVKPDLDAFEIVDVERSVKMPLPGGLEMIGQVDGLWRHKKTKVLFIVEHKFKEQHDEDLMALDLQVSLYTMLLLGEFGLLPTLYNVVRKPLYKLGKEEKLEDFRERNAKKIADEFKPLVYKPLDMTNRYPVRQAYSRGQLDLKVAHAQVLEMTKRMLELDAHPEMVYRNVGQECLYLCPFKNICLEEDPLVIDALFIRKKAPGTFKREKVVI